MFARNTPIDRHRALDEELDMINTRNVAAFEMYPSKMMYPTDVPIVWPLLTGVLILCFAAPARSQSR